MPKQARGILNLVDDDGRRITLKETLRLLLGLLGFGGKIERHECVIWKQVPEGRGLAGLPGSGQHDHGYYCLTPAKVKLATLVFRKRWQLCQHPETRYH